MGWRLPKAFPSHDRAGRRLVWFLAVAGNAGVNPGLSRNCHRVVDPTLHGHGFSESEGRGERRSGSQDTCADQLRRGRRQSDLSRKPDMTGALTVGEKTWRAARITLAGPVS
jgi:hypothetical protein